MPPDERRALPLVTTPDEQTGAYLQDRLARGFSNLVSLPRAAQDLTTAGIERVLNLAGVEVTPENMESFRKIAGFPFSAIPQDPIAEIQERTGVDVMTGAEPQSTTEINVGDFLEGAASFPFNPAGAATAGMANVTGQGSRRMVENLGGGETAQTVAEIGGALAGGMGTGAIRGAAGAAAAPRSPAAPVVESLRRSANKAYKAAENAGAVIKQPAYKTFADRISRRMAREGIDPDIHPEATAALKRLQKEVGSAQSLEKMDTLRQVVRDVGASTKPAERRLARIMTDRLDKFVERLRPQDLISGDSKAAVSALKEGRNLWSRMRKGEIIEGLIERAGTRAGQFSGSGYENALRTEFRNLALNERRLRGFSKAEIKAIKDVARGSSLGNIARFFGKASPTGIVSGTLGPALGAYVAGPVGAVAVPAGGYLSRQAATKLTDRAARAASELVRRGAPPPPSTGRKILQRRLAEALAPTAATMLPAAER